MSEARGGLGGRALRAEGGREGLEGGREGAWEGAQGWRGEEGRRGEEGLLWISVSLFGYPWIPLPSWISITLFGYPFGYPSLILDIQKPEMDIHHSFWISIIPFGYPSLFLDIQNTLFGYPFGYP